MNTVCHVTPQACAFASFVELIQNELRAPMGEAAREPNTLHLATANRRAPILPIGANPIDIGTGLR
jgi:hypothetical protein